MIRRLDKREQDIIRRRFGLVRDNEPETLSEVSKRFGISKERVRQIQSNALIKLREAARHECVDN